MVQMKLMIRKSFQSCKALLTFGSWSGEQQRTDWDRCTGLRLHSQNIQIQAQALSVGMVLNRTQAPIQVLGEHLALAQCQTK